MAYYPLTTLIPLVAGAAWVLAIIVLGAHRARFIVGLMPLLVILGGIAGFLQFPVTGTVLTSVANHEIEIQLSTFLFLPVLLMGLLIVYIVEGSTQARSALFGILAITGLAVISRTVTTFEHSFEPGKINRWFMGDYMRDLTATALSLGGGLTLLVLVYPWISNLHKRYPSIPAALVAFLAALCTDALIYSATSFLGEIDVWHKIITHFGGITFSGIMLMPLVSLYLVNYSRSFPSSTLASPRPVMDIFTTSVELEARARHNYNLLQTILTINHQVVNATNLQTLLNQACQLLVGNQEYLVACVYLTSDNPVTAWAGQDPSFITACLLNDADGEDQHSPAKLVLQSQKTLVINRTSLHSNQDSWVKTAHQHGLESLACFPITHEKQPLGIMLVGAAREQAFDDEEVDLLLGLVRDLSNAITNYQVRQAQITLFTAAEMLPDGLLVTDLNGHIVYLNPTVVHLLEVDANQVLGKKISSLVPGKLPDEVLNKYVQILQDQKSLALEFDLEIARSKKYSLSLRAALVYDSRHTPRQVVISVRDITSRKQYERQLIALNQLITDLVQRHSKEEFIPFVFAAAEELLQAKASALYIVDAEGKIVDLMAHNLPEDYTQRMAQSYNGLPCEKVLRTGTPVYVSDVTTDPDYRATTHFMTGYNIRALMSLPVSDDHRTSGALVVYYEHEHKFTNDEVQLGMTLAHTVAIALKNLSLYQAERSQRQFAEGLAQAAASLNRLLNPDEVFDQILAQTMQITDCHSANIMLVEGTNLHLAHHKGHSPVAVPSSEAENIFMPIRHESIQSMFNSSEPLLIGDTTHDRRWLANEPTQWVCSYAGVPLQVSGSVVGLLNVYSGQAGAFSPDTIQRLQALADHASIAIHNAELYSESYRQAQELSALVQSAAMVSTSLEVNQVLDELSREMAHLVDAEACAISTFNQADQTVTPLAYYKEPATRLQPTNRETYNLPDYPSTLSVLQENTVIQLHADDPQIDQAEIERMKQSGVKTRLMLPLVAQEVTLGLVELDSSNVSRIFSPREIALLQTLGANAANAIQNAHLYTQLQEYASQLEQRVEERTTELRSAKEHIESILASISDAIFVLDDQFQPIRANQAGDQLGTHAEADGINLFEPVFLERLRRGNLPPENSILQVQGRFYQALASPFPVRPDEVGLVVVFRDVTRFRELDEIKNHFVSDVSHEFRTPLTNLILYLDLLSASSDPAKGKGYIATLQRETKRLGFLIEDLLTISRLEAGRVNISIMPMDVNDLITDLVNDRKMFASSKQLTLSFKPGISLPPALSDASFLSQAISNLLTNAINYTPPGGTVTLSTHLRRDEDGEWVTIDVTDTGVGISTEEQMQIFERFYRGTASKTTGAPGTGLGLAIAQGIASRLSGKLTVTSQPGEGSTFSFWLKAVL